MKRAKNKSPLMPFSEADDIQPTTDLPATTSPLSPDGSAIVNVVNHDTSSGNTSAGVPNATDKGHAPALKQPDEGRRAFRADLQGLRSMAAILIAMGHIWTPSASGGVGVFYFIGGFFVIGSLHRKTSFSGQLDVGAFLTHTFSRIVPEAYAAIVLIALLVCLWLSPMDRADNLTDGFSSAVFLTNWWFRYKNTDYLARDANLSAYLLFWSLADIVQIYAMNAMVYWALTKSVPKARLDFAGVCWLLLQVAGSFFYLVYLLHTDQYLTAYFETPLWVWMFAAGALTSRFAHKLQVSVLVSAVLTSAAAALIMTVCLCILVLGQVPTQLRFGLLGAAVMVVIAGETPTPSKLLTYIFGNQVFVHLGNNSYFIFLLHWPIVLSFMQVSGHWSSSIFRGVTILAITLVLAEACSRAFAWLRSRRLHKPSIQFMLLWVPINLLLLHSAFSASRTDNNTMQTAGLVTVTQSALHPGAMAVASRVIDSTQLSTPFLPRPEDADMDRPRLYDTPSCRIAPATFRCDFGNIGSGTVVALFGASHTIQWSVAMEDLAIMYSWELRVYAKHGCDFYIGKRGTPGHDCTQWLPETMAQLQASPPSFLFVMGTQAPSHITEIALHEEAAQFYASMRALGTTVVALRHTPRSAIDIPRCAATHIDGNYLKECSPPLSMFKDEVMNQVIASGIHDTFIDTKDLFCDDTSCPAVIGNVFVYRDKHHVTASYMHSLVPLLERKLRMHVPSLFESRTPQAANATTHDDTMARIGNN